MLMEIVPEGKRNTDLYKVFTALPAVSTLKAVIIRGYSRCLIKISIARKWVVMI